jgi:hypothetical protein
MSTQTKPWEVVSYLSSSGAAGWYVCRDRFAGRDWLLNARGARKRHRLATTAQAAADRLNAKEKS